MGPRGAAPHAHQNHFGAPGEQPPPAAPQGGSVGWGGGAGRGARRGGDCPAGCTITHHHACCRVGASAHDRAVAPRWPPARPPASPPPSGAAVQRGRACHRGGAPPPHLPGAGRREPGGGVRCFAGVRVATFVRAAACLALRLAVATWSNHVGLFFGSGLLAPDTARCPLCSPSNLRPSCLLAWALGGVRRSPPPLAPWPWWSACAAACAARACGRRTTCRWWVGVVGGGGGGGRQGGGTESMTGTMGPR